MIPSTVYEYIPRLPTRGWREYTIVCIGFVGILGFLGLMMNWEMETLSDGVRVGYRSEYVYDLNITEEEVAPTVPLLII